MDVERRLEMVETENAVLRERVRVLEEKLVGVFNPPLEWGLTGQERLVLGVLVTRELATKSTVMAALYRSLGKDEAAPKIVDVFVCKIRRKLKPYGVVIKTIWGIGYELDPVWRARLQGREADEGRAAA